ncbi:MAG: AlpA family phage regulatory protein [candidate division WOR-3 bacterium]
MEFLRPKDIMKKMKISRTLLYSYIKKGIFPKPIKMGATISVWLNTEIESIMIAMYKQENEDNLRKLVKEIELSRKETLNN